MIGISHEKHVIIGSRYRLEKNTYRASLQVLHLAYKYSLWFYWKDTICKNSTRKICCFQIVFLIFT